MLLKHWAAKQGICYRTALRWFHDGKLPVEATQTQTGSILVGRLLPSTEGRSGCTVYARVSSHDQKSSLETQLKALREFCAARGIRVIREVAEIGSGLNGRRAKLLQLLAGEDDIAVTHRDRLMRFGVEYVEASLEQAGRKLLVLNDNECKDDLVQDFIDVTTSMCARIYGRRSAKIRSAKALKAAGE